MTSNALFATTQSPHLRLPRLRRSETSPRLARLGVMSPEELHWELGAAWSHKAGQSQLLIRLIRLAAEKADFEAAKKLEQKARLADNVEIAIVNFHDAFVKAEQQINDKYEKSQKRLIEVQEEMNEEEHLILQILLEAA